MKDVKLMFYVGLISVMMILGVNVIAQDKKPAAPTQVQATPPKAEVNLEVAPKSALRIRDTQLRLIQAQQQLSQAQQAFEKAITTAFTESNVDATKFQIDDQRWVFIPNPPAQQALPSEPDKKDVKK